MSYPLILYGVAATGTISNIQEPVASGYVLSESGIPIYHTPGTDYLVPLADWVALSVATGETIPTITYTYTQATETVLKYHTFIHPTEGTQLLAFSSTDIYRYVDGVWASCLNSTVKAAIAGYDIDQWSVTDFIDMTVGATVVAAGSAYTRPTESYIEGASRTLLYYDPTGGADTYGEFVALQLYTNTLVDEELQTMTIATANTVITDTVTNTDVVAGSLYLIVEDLGVIAYAGLQIYDVEGTPYNLLIPVDDSQCIYGPNSFVELETGNISLEFVDTTYTGKLLYAYYEYKLEVDYKPLYITNYQSALIMANTSEFIDSSWLYYPWRVRWTTQGDMTLVQEADYQELAIDDISPILGMRALETVTSGLLVGPIYFYKHNSIVRGTYNQSYNLDPDVPLPFLSFELAYSEGVEAVNTITSIEGNHFFLGRNDVYVFNGTTRTSLTRDSDTGSTRIQRTLFSELNLSKLQTCFGLYDEIDRKYMLFITVSGQNYPTKAYVYDLDLDAWSTYTFPLISAGLVADFQLTGQIQNLLGTIEDLEGDIDSLTENTRKLMMLAFDTISCLMDERTGYDLVDYAPVAYTSSWITRDFFGSTLEDQDRIQKVFIEGYNGELTIGYNPYYEFSNFEHLDTVSFSSQYRRESYFPDVVANNIRFELTITPGTEIRWMQVFSQKQEFTNE